MHIEKKHSTLKIDHHTGESFWRKLRCESTMMFKCVIVLNIYCPSTKKKNLNRNTLFISDIQLAQQLWTHWTAMLVVTAIHLWPQASWKQNKEEKKRRRRQSWASSIIQSYWETDLNFSNFPGNSVSRVFSETLNELWWRGVLSCLGGINKLLNCMRKYVLHCWEHPSPWFHPLKCIFFYKLLKSLPGVPKCFHWCCSIT